MSRLAKRPIPVPKSTEVNASGGMLVIKGPKGELARPMHRLVTVAVGPEGVQVTPKGSDKEARSMLGTFAAHVRNMIRGVNEGFTKKLIIEGVGYKWDVSGKTLNLGVGFSHPVQVAIPEGLTVTAEKNTLSVSGHDKEVVGQFAANVRKLRKPEPYKGKGIRYENEIVRRKQGKKAA